ncbi:hypothetical protein [Carnobacterium sp.]|uniref:hypothetical protein n=1 Tax=Carnobacterium sp. TaxID=48221 RepID=UPI003C7834C6
MDGFALLGILAFAYAGIVFFITFKKPEAIWNIGKIKGFRKVLGEKGTVLFFYTFGLLAIVLGIWLMTM